MILRAMFDYKKSSLETFLIFFSNTTIYMRSLCNFYYQTSIGKLVKGFKGFIYTSTWTCGHDFEPLRLKEILESYNTLVLEHLRYLSIDHISNNKEHLRFIAT